MKMSEKTFHKLVRDRIPEIIKNNGEESVVRVLEDEEYQVELYKKLLEESNEVIGSKNPDETLEELADVLEIVKSIAELHHKSLEDVMEIATQKRINRGGFEKRLLLEKTCSK